MFDPDGFNLGPWLPQPEEPEQPEEHDDPEEIWQPIPDEPVRSMFWPMFVVGFILAIVII